MGVYPQSVHRAIRNVLGQMNLKFLADDDLPEDEAAVLFHIDDWNYIIAKDFEVDVPDLGHNPDWCRIDK